MSFTNGSEGYSWKFLLVVLIESGSLSVALSHDETAGGIASSVISTIYATVAIKL